MPAAKEFRATFETLKQILKRFEPKLTVVRFRPGIYYLDAGHDARGKHVCFAAVAIRKAFVSYSLMPVYLFPDLLDDIPAELAARRHGKSCFNFKVIEPKLVRQLAALTKAGFERYQQAGMLPDKRAATRKRSPAASKA